VHVVRHYAVGKNREGTRGKEGRNVRRQFIRVPRVGKPW
jgi:hypothetical protein